VDAVFQRFFADAQNVGSCHAERSEASQRFFDDAQNDNKDEKKPDKGKKLV
jgi:hypothetical protein